MTVRYKKNFIKFTYVLNNFLKELKKIKKNITDFSPGMLKYVF